MKKVILLSFILVLLAWKGNAQSIPTYPIPSTDINVSGYANFRELTQEITPNPNKGKREVDVETKPGSGNHQICTATVWVYSIDQSTVLGPFTVYCNQVLSVPIDNRQWGVLIETELAELVSVKINN